MVPNGQQSTQKKLRKLENNRRDFENGKVEEVSFEAQIDKISKTLKLIVGLIARVFHKAIVLPRSTKIETMI